MVRTEIFDLWMYAQSGKQLCTLILSETGDDTHLHLTIRYPTREARDAALASGIEHGMRAGSDRLEEMINKDEFE